MCFILFFARYKTTGVNSAATNVSVPTVSQMTKRKFDDLDDTFGNITTFKEFIQNEINDLRIKKKKLKTLCEKLH